MIVFSLIISWPPYSQGLSLGKIVIVKMCLWQQAPSVNGAQLWQLVMYTIRHSLYMMLYGVSILD